MDAPPGGFILGCVEGFDKDLRHVFARPGCELPPVPRPPFVAALHSGKPGAQALGGMALAIHLPQPPGRGSMQPRNGTNRHAIFRPILPRFRSRGGASLAVCSPLGSGLCEGRSWIDGRSARAARAGRGAGPFSIWSVLLFQRLAGKRAGGAACSHARTDVRGTIQSNAHKPCPIVVGGSGDFSGVVAAHELPEPPALTINLAE
jgi:hypothetical protein